MPNSDTGEVGEAEENISYDLAGNLLPLGIFLQVDCQQAGGVRSEARHKHLAFQSQHMTVDGLVRLRQPKALSRFRQVQRGNRHGEGQGRSNRAEVRQNAEEKEYWKS